MNRRALLLQAAVPLLGFAALTPGGPGDEVQKGPERYPDHTRLLWVVDGQGSGRPVKSAPDWRSRREHILRGMEDLMGEFGGRPGGSWKSGDLDLRVEEVVEAGPFTRKRISFVSEPGDRVPAFLLVPRERKGRVPAVLCLHQTTSIGKAEPAGLGGRESLHYAAHLAARGYVTLAPDYLNFGDHPFDAYAHGYRSGCMKAIRDNLRAVDLLQSLPEVDPERIGCIGHSLGGHTTLFTAAFDERIKALVSNCGFTAFESYMHGDLRGWSGRAYMPRILSYRGFRDLPFDFHEVVGAIAPRPFLAIAPLADSNFDVEGVRAVIRSAREVYRLLGAEERLAAEHPDCGHDFPPEARERAYAWLDRWLSPAGKPGG